MSLHAQFRKDVEQVWLQVTPQVEMLCGFVDSRSAKWQAKLTEKTRSVRKLIEHNALPPDKDRMYAVQVFVDLCLFDWRTVPNGVEPGRPEIEIAADEWLPFSKENAERILTAYPKLYLDIIDLAQDLKLFQVSTGDVKN